MIGVYVMGGFDPFEHPARLNTAISSCDFSGLNLASRNPPILVFSHTKQYLNHSRLLITSMLVNGWLAVSTTAPRGFNARLKHAHNGSNGITTSHLQAVVP